ncbi:MAG TPA: HAMP domain-containing protein [Burkholderiales bacterium]|nr:HAMP domain-containing protein [Burkholderiales bacterium]
MMLDRGELLKALRQFKRGDFSVRMPLNLTGVDGEIAQAFNDVVELEEAKAAEIARVAELVGKEGQFGHRMSLPGATGGWADVIDSINTLVGDVIYPVHEVARVLGSVAKGDLSHTMVLESEGRPLRGEALRLGTVLNTIVGQLNAFASEVSRVAREVGSEGKLGGQAQVPGVAGVWKDLTENVNTMAANLTGQVRNIADVTTAVAKGDLSRKITAEARGEIFELKSTINTMVDQLNAFAGEVSRVAREVGSEGKLGGQAQVKGVGGVWKDLTDNVNSMAANLTSQVRNIADVTKAVAAGDLSRKITVEVKGEVLELKSTINTMVDQLNAFTGEVSRVAREVGTDGKLGGQAHVPGVAGVWKDLTDNVNQLAANLTGQVRNIAEVTTAVAKGDLSRKITVDVKGEVLELKSTVNTMVDQLNAFAFEVSRVVKEVGTEGKLGGQAHVKGVAGVWKDLTDNVNSMAANLTGQVRNIAEVATSVAKGDLSKKISAEAQGEIAELKNTFNTLVDQLNSFVSEVTRVAREVGTDGKLGGQAQVPGVAGVWKDLTDNVNQLAANLTGQVRNIAEVTIAVAKGDLSRKITVDVKGEVLELKSTVNTMVDQLNAFASEVSRVAKEVGTDGKLGGQAQVVGVAGVWKDLTDNVNSMAANLTGQVRNIADVTTAVARGDLSKKITVDVKGEILELKSTINTMVDQLNGFAAQVTRVAREVGSEGKLGGQAHVRGVGGVWKDLTDNVNSMAANLTGQVRNLAEVTTAVAKGDLSKKITAEAKGEILALKSTINTMVDQLNAFAGEVSRVAREVGSDGKLGGQAQVKGVAGVWKDLTDNVNSMAANLTGQVRNIAEVTTAVAKGDLSKKITVDVRGEILELKSTINTMVDQLNAFASEVSRVAKEVGTEGKLGGQAQVVGVAGVWKDLTDNVNSMAANLTGQVRNIAEVTTAVARGDLSRKITVDVRGEILELKNTVNTMVDQLNAFASEVSRIAKEVGAEGKLGGQAQVRGAGGVWNDLTANVNSMAANLTSQVRGIASVVNAVASGDLTRKLTVEAKGEIAALADTINGMIDTLAIFAEQVTNVAREVGSEGKLGGQARVPGAAGTWRDLIENVNRLAANLTTQVRAIAEVATAVTKGDLTRSIAVDAQGEVASLKDNINEMIRNLKDTTRKNTEQDWLKTHLARFTRMLQGHRDLVTVSRLILSELTPLVNAQQAAFYVADHRSGDSTLELLAGYAQRHSKSLPRKIAFGEGLVGQCAFEKKRIALTGAPSDYIRISSALGSGAPVNIVILPVLFEGQVKAVIELASFSKFSEIHQTFLDQLTESIGVVLHTIAANMQTEYLLHQSQSLTAELQAQQEELKKTNDRLEQQALNLQKSESLLKSKQDELRAANEQLQEKARQLSEQMHQVEFKNREIEQARAALEEKAEQLSLSSRYKSEFLANMSHELRTPLNSLLILARLLADNVGGNLTSKQVEFARTIHSSGAELLALINDILDLAKIESGTVTLNIAAERFADVCDYVERTFRQMATDKSLELTLAVDEKLPAAMETDGKRLQQIITNLLSNAFKFTSRGKVSLRVAEAQSGWTPGHPILEQADHVVSFAVTDTGIGIPASKQRLIFEAFQQADGTTSREYGGTGLGLSISRELARLLGGEIRVTSTPGQGSTFTLYLPLSYEATPELPREPFMEPEPPVRARRADEPALAPVGEELAHTVAPRAAQELAGRKVLVVDDDIRNVFALTSALEAHGMQVLHAESGKEGIELLKHTPEIDLVLMDVMMPGLDGLDTMRIIRQLDGYQSLPIIAVTAKAMMGDRDKCLEAGATDYVAKPVNIDVLLATLWRTLPQEARLNG